MDTAIQQILATGVVGATAIIFYFSAKDSRDKYEQIQEKRVLDQKENIEAFKGISEKVDTSIGEMKNIVLQTLELIKAFISK